MRKARVLGWLSLAILRAAASAQVATIAPQIRSTPTADHQITTIELIAHFVTTIRVSEPVNSIVVGDPALFQVEHSEREPELVFVKALTTEDAESNLLLSTGKGHQISFLLVSHGPGANSAKVDFLMRYQGPWSFLIEPEALPFALIPQTTSVSKAQSLSGGPITNTTEPSRTVIPAAFDRTGSQATLSQPQQDSLDSLLERQKQAPLPVLYGQRVEGDEVKGAHLRTGISEVLEGDQQVMVLFSVVNPSKHTILLMPPQVQLGGRKKSGTLIKHQRWATAEQLAVIDFRLSRRRIGSGERADGVVLFQRPAFKRSNETLFLQMAESGAVDKPALAPIGFGVGTVREAANRGQ
ncbi:MAG TPA: hypothetical protein VEI01_20235 [Terriglobales bacterium]|nr:hypothetical protein [Terriglobales bacterium]